MSNFQSHDSLGRGERVLFIYGLGRIFRKGSCVIARKSGSTVAHTYLENMPMPASHVTLMRLVLLLDFTTITKQR